jgi:hypothetical protein
VAVRSRYNIHEAGPPSLIRKRSMPLLIAMAPRTHAIIESGENIRRATPVIHKSRRVSGRWNPTADEPSWPCQPCRGLGEDPQPPKKRGSYLRHEAACKSSNSLAPPFIQQGHSRGSSHAILLTLVLPPSVSCSGRAMRCSLVSPTWRCAHCAGRSFCQIGQ